MPAVAENDTQASLHATSERSGSSDEVDLNGDDSGSVKAGEIVDWIEYDVRVDPRINGAEGLQQWVEEELRKSLADHGFRGAVFRGTVSIDISGRTYDYRTTLIARRGDQVLGAPEEWACECSNEELLDEVRARVPSVVARLEVRDAPEPVVVRPAPPVKQPPDSAVGDSDGTRKRLGPVGSAGVALMTFGAAGVATGGTLIWRGEQPVSDLYLGQRDHRDFWTPGIVTAGISGGVFIAGVVLVAVRKRAGRHRARTTLLTPSLNEKGRIALSFSGRF